MWRVQVLFGFEKGVEQAWMKQEGSKSRLTSDRTQATTYTCPFEAMRIAQLTRQWWDVPVFQFVITDSAVTEKSCGR
jgi:hypothetical protein